MHSSFDPRAPRLAGTAAITAVVIIGTYTLLLRHEGDGSDGSAVSATGQVSVVTAATPTPTASASLAAAATATPTSNATPAATATPASGYKDGTYAVTVSYYVPHGQNSLTVKVTLANGSVSAVTASSDYTDFESERYTGSFESEIQGAVVGQAVDAAGVSRLGGASLTSAAFNDAIARIAASAKA